MAEHYLQQLGYVFLVLNFGYKMFHDGLRTSIITTFILLFHFLHRLQNVILIGLILAQTIEMNSLSERQGQLKTELKKSGRSKGSLIFYVMIVYLAQASFFYQVNY
jgi:hypothetical protein